MSAFAAYLAIYLLSAVINSLTGVLVAVREITGRRCWPCQKPGLCPTKLMSIIPSPIVSIWPSLSIAGLSAWQFCYTFFFYPLAFSFTVSFVSHQRIGSQFNFSCLRWTYPGCRLYPFWTDKDHFWPEPVRGVLCDYAVDVADLVRQWGKSGN